MLHELEIENFRCFEKLTAKPLGRVNLLVGKNNSGKTAFLDAVEMLMSRGPVSWRDGLLRRGEFTEETVKDFQTGVLTSQWVWFPLSLFRGHQFKDGNALSIRSGQQRIVLRSQNKLVGSVEHRVLACERTIVAGHSPLTFNDVADGPLVLLNDGRLYAPPVYAPPDPSPQYRSVLYLPTERAAIAAMSPLWDEAQAGDEDALVHETLRFIEPRVDRLFVRGDGVNRNFWVRLKGQKELVRLGSLGDGMNHMLAIALFLVNAKDRILLIDEIDTGLHYTVLSKMWKMVIESARRLNIQVFATTHSMDCILALAEVHQQLELTPEDLMVHRLVAGMDKTQTYQPNDLVSVAQFQGEVR